MALPVIEPLGIARCRQAQLEERGRKLEEMGCPECPFWMAELDRWLELRLSPKIDWLVVWGIFQLFLIYGESMVNL